MKRRISKKKKSRLNKSFDKVSKALRNGNPKSINKAIKSHIKSLKSIGEKPGLYELMVK